MGNLKNSLILRERSLEINVLAFSSSRPVTSSVLFVLKKQAKFIEK
jgi:hypothetical protein